MGTRHCTIVKLDGETKVGQYGQWDGYPSGQGATILSFLKSADMNKFKDQLRKTRFLTKEEIKKTWKECGAGDSDWVGLDVADKHTEKYPALSRDTGAEVLQLIYDGKAYELDNDEDFIKDEVSCEWAYEINLDDNTLRVMNGADKVYNLNELPKESDFIAELENYDED